MDTPVTPNGANSVDTTTAVLQAWARYSATAFGETLPINYIDIDEESNSGDIGYQVPAGSPPLELVDGRAVRLLTLHYDLEEITDRPELLC